MDQAVKEDLLDALQEDEDLEEEDRRILVDIIERYDPEVRELMQTAMDEDNDEAVDEAIESVMEDLVSRGLLDGKAEFLWNPEHKRWKDIIQCDSMLQDAFMTWMEIEWG